MNGIVTKEPDEWAENALVEWVDKTGAFGK